VPFVLIVSAATAAAFLLPKRYGSSCLVLIKASRVPDKIIGGASEDLDARRHQTIRQEILSRTRLEKVNDELHPFPDAQTTAAAVESMQKVIAVEFRGSDAFSIEFTHRDPYVAQRVTDRIATLFIQEFRRSRQSQFEGASEFLDSELQEARRQLDAKEEALRLYKERHMGQLPEQLEATLATLQRLQLEMQSLAQSLEAAESRLDRLVSRGSPDLPAPAGATGLSERETLELELVRLRQRYTDQHPDVQAILARLRSMEPAPVEPSSPAVSRDSIAAGQLERARADVNALLARRRDLQDEISALQERVELMPRTEQELATLTRDFNQLRENYQTVLRRKMDAQMAERLEQRWTEDFEILDHARLPETHRFPNKPLFILAGIVVGLGLGLGAAVLAEVLNPSVITQDDLEATVSIPVLAVLPAIEAEEAEAARRYLASKRPPHDGRRRASEHP
jgi:polysaccharide chain length determinant protein (PEP-CTERM system associated)